MTLPLSHTGYLAIQSVADGVDHVAVEMERKWGAGRLRLLVPIELRERFDRQMAKWADAIRRNDVADVTLHGAATERAWRALDAAAEAAGASPLAPVVWETATDQGEVIAIVRSVEDARAVAVDGRQVQVWTLDEIARVIGAYPTVGQVKQVFPGATVTAVRQKPEPDWSVGDDIADLLHG